MKLIFTSLIMLTRKAADSGTLRILVKFMNVRLTLLKWECDVVSRRRE